MHSSKRLIVALCCACALGAHGAPASAQDSECTTDEDCPAGRVCEVIEDVDTPSATSSSCEPAPCTDDADCPSGLKCERGGCRPQPITCSADADCPAGLVCVEDERDRAPTPACAPPADGGAPCEQPPMEDPPAQPATFACGYVPASCDSDSDCETGYACLAAGAQPACDDGCTPEPRLTCFPARADCSDDSDCDADWRCLSLPEGSDRSGPMGYEGATRVCWPEGLVLLALGQIELADSSSSDEGSVQPDSHAAETLASEDGSCAVSKPGSTRAGLAGLALVALGGLARAGRKRRDQST